MIEKYCLNIPIGEIKTLLCKSYSWFTKRKKLQNLVPTNIKLNDPIDYVKKLNALEESLVSPCLAFVQIWQFQGGDKYSIEGSNIDVSPNVNFTQSI